MILRENGHLDLRHGWPTFADSTASTWANARGAGHECNDCGGSEQSEQEPEESGRSLKLTAALGHIIRAIGGWVADEVGLETVRFAKTIE